MSTVATRGRPVSLLRIGGPHAIGCTCNQCRERNEIVDRWRVRITEALSKHHADEERMDREWAL